MMLQGDFNTKVGSTFDPNNMFSNKNRFLKNM